MALWCLDNVASAKVGRPQFRIPYPKGNWYEEKQANFLYTALMPVAYKFAALGIRAIEAEGGKNKLSEEDLDELEKIWEIEDKMELDSGY